MMCPGTLDMTKMCAMVVHLGHKKCLAPLVCVLSRVLREVLSREDSGSWQKTFIHHWALAAEPALDVLRNS